MSQRKNNRVLNALAAIIDCLKRGRVPYMMIGAWALAAWGRPRATMDLDFMVIIDDNTLDHLGKALFHEGFSLDETWLEWNPMLKDLQRRLEFQGVTIDLMRPRDEHDNQAFDRRKKKKLTDRFCWIIAPEDFILQKLKAGGIPYGKEIGRR